MIRFLPAHLTAPFATPFATLSTAMFITLLPFAAAGDCPVAADLDGGIAFTGAQGEREVFIRADDDTVTAAYTSGNGFASEALLAHGVFLIDFRDRIGTEYETRMSYEFPMAIKEMSLPRAGTDWDITVSVSDGDNNVFERQVYRYGALEEHRYGACAYEVIPFTAEYSTAPEVVETYHYLPALGLSYLFSYADPTGSTTYPYNEIRALP